MPDLHVDQFPSPVSLDAEPLFPAARRGIRRGFVPVHIREFRQPQPPEEARTRRWRGTAISGVVSLLFHSGKLVSFGDGALSWRSLSSAFCREMITPPSERKNETAATPAIHCHQPTEAGFKSHRAIAISQPAAWHGISIIIFLIIVVGVSGNSDSP